MTPVEFQDGMTRLRTRKEWASSMDVSFASSLWTKVTRFSFKVFAEVIDDLFGQHQKPTAMEIIDRCLSKNREMGSTSENNIAEYDCDFCDNNGTLFMTPPKGDPLKNEILVCCSRCPNGRIVKTKTLSFFKNKEGGADGGLPEAMDCYSRGFVPVLKKLQAQYSKLGAAQNPLAVQKASLEKECPWPMGMQAVMASCFRLMTGFTEGEESKHMRCLVIGTRAVGITDRVAWKLYEFYIARDFKNPAALQIIATARNVSLSDVLRGMVKWSAAQSPTQVSIF